ncbi:MAG: MMPL family transporter [Oscillospiraceae bacterium]|jgi:predicted RND superfamily exporter protein|nr:MMPL family transporter [Oscillospiraceae bacterium]
MSFVQRLLKHKRLVIILFVVVCIVSALLIPATGINYQLADYLPENTPSTVALVVLNEEFSSAMPNMRVLIPDLSIPQALAMKKNLESESFVSNVMWLDDYADLSKPLELADSAVTEAWYKDGQVLYMLTCKVSEKWSEKQIYNAVQSHIGSRGAISGEIAETVASQSSVTSEVSRILLFVIPMILIIILLTTNSWFTPVLFAVVILSGIVLNLGTNFVFGEISFLTQTIAPVLQLAVSMDYSIFLLAAFDRNKDMGRESVDAMAHAVRETAATVLASGATTFIGFLVLGFMRFKIGPDLGFTLAKGIVFSVVSSLVLLPCVTLACRGAMVKLKHKPLLPKFDGLARVLSKTRIPVLIIVVLLLVPAFLAQRNNSFTYGAGGIAQGSKIGEDEILINSEFGTMSQLVLLVPKGQSYSEEALVRDITAIPYVTNVTGYVTAVGSAVPSEFVPAESLAQLESENYRRYIISISTVAETPESFEVVENIRSVAEEYYGDTYHFVGAAVNNYDMRETIEADNKLVSLLCIASIALVLLITFRSVSLPLILLLTIEGAIWINLAIPYFQGSPLHFIAYMIVSTVQLGSTIDYAILFTDHYMAKRLLGMAKKNAAVSTISETFTSILVPVLILVFAGATLAVISSNSIVSAFGEVLSRGAALSALLVLLFLPGLLILFDTVIRKTTLLKK